jgi:outer membrane protein OmpA-like peptidoglycan-associated protein
MSSRRLVAYLLLLAAAAVSCDPPPGGAGSSSAAPTISPLPPGVTKDGHSYRSIPEQSTGLLIALSPKNMADSSRKAVELLQTNRRNEHVDVVCGQQTIFSSVTPTGDDITELVTAPEPTHPSGTQVQNAERKREESDYANASNKAMNKVASRQRDQLTAWQKSVQDAIEHATCATIDPARTFADDLGQAEGFFSSLAQAHLNLGAHKAVAILGADGMPMTPSPALSGKHLQGTTVVISPFPGTWPEQAGWQAALVEGGVGRAVLLTPGAVSELPRIVTEGLRDAKVFNISADTLFALGSSKLEEAGKAALKPALDYVIAYADVEIISNGFTDSLPVPMGNDQLSQDRASEVRQYLIDNGVPADRIQAVGHGDHDPVAPDGPGGQPLNRRVVVVVNPIGPAN